MKAVVHGGADRQSRSAGEAVPFGDFAGLLDRFEVEQRVGTLVRERVGAPPAADAVDVLDRVFRMEIRPTIDALEKSLKTLGALVSSDVDDCSCDRGRAGESKAAIFSKPATGTAPRRSGSSRRAFRWTMRSPLN